MLTQSFDLSLINFEKNLLLNSLKSNNSIYKYKRCVYSPLRYAGGKSLAVGYIIELLPDKIKRLISPFLGGGSLEIFISKELKIPVIANDIFDILINYWEYQINHPMDLYNELIKIEPTKESYTLIKNELKKTWDKVNGSNNYLNPLKKAAYYYFNHNLSYGPGFLGWMSSNYLNKKKYLSLLERVRNFSVSNFKVYSQSFEDFLIRYKHDFLYSDPPYYLYNDSKMFKGIYPMRNFPMHHNNFNHELLFEILKNHKGKFILSYNDCSWVRNKYKEFNIKEVKWQYTMGQGETRIGKNRLGRGYDNNNIKKSHELLITNY